MEAEQRPHRDVDETKHRRLDLPANRTFWHLRHTCHLLHAHNGLSENGSARVVEGDLSDPRGPLGPQRVAAGLSIGSVPGSLL